MFKDISHFNDTTDYLPIITAILIVEIITIILSFTNITQSGFLKVWYKEYKLSAVLADVSLIFLGIVIARALYPFIFDTFSILYFILLVVVIQVIHDILFYIMINLMFFLATIAGFMTIGYLFLWYASRMFRIIY